MGSIVAGVLFLRGTVDAIYTKDIPCSYGPKESDYGLECSDPYRDLHWAGDQRLPAGRVLIWSNPCQCCDCGSPLWAG